MRARRPTQPRCMRFSAVRGDDLCVVEVPPPRLPGRLGKDAGSGGNVPRDRVIEPPSCCATGLATREGRSAIRPGIDLTASNNPRSARTARQVIECPQVRARASAYNRKSVE